MSSATSIKGLQLKPDVAAKAEAPRQHGAGDRGTSEAAGGDAAGHGFRPWHFFVLASLATATAAVLLSRRSSPEHLVLLSLTIGAAGLAAAALYRMLAPLALRDVSHLSETPSRRARAALEREKSLVLRSIKELEFDRAMGKVSSKDFDEMAGRLRARALVLMKQVDAGASGYRELIERELQQRLKRRDAASSANHPTAADRESADPPPELSTAIACAACGTNNDADAAFCKRCGTALAVPQ